VRRWENDHETTITRDAGVVHVEHAVASDA
jgi:hypothetical protein